MPVKKKYYCCICHKKIKDKPIRLIKQEYGAGTYKQYYQVDRYDICKICYVSFDRWINKHRKV